MATITFVTSNSHPVRSVYNIIFLEYISERLLLCYDETCLSSDKQSRSIVDAVRIIFTL